MTKKVNIAIFGAAGKMGVELCQMVNQYEEAELVCAIERPDHESMGQQVQAQNSSVVLTTQDTTDFSNCDVMISFTTAEGIKDAIDCACKNNIALVIGTTGFDDSHAKLFVEAQKKIAFLHETNMSLGMLVMQDLVKQATQTLSSWDVEIAESHHRDKVDAPSGTALTLAQVVKDTATNRGLTDIVRSVNHGKRQDKEIGMSFIRAGDIAGDHTVMFAGLGERIEITHRAHSKRNFAHGAVFAAVHISKQKTGRYRLRDFLTS